MSQPWRRSRHAALFLAPAFVLLALFVVWPMVQAAFWSGQRASYIRADRAEWNAGRNYTHLAEDPRFRRAFANTALFVLMVVPAQAALALALALWVNRPQPYWRWLRVVFFLPLVISMPVLAVLWKLLYQPTAAGPLNGLIGLAGIPPQQWLEDPRLALSAIAVMSIWQGVGFQMMIFLAGLQTVPHEQVEAALIDGAGPWQRLIHVVLPNLRNSIIFAVSVTTILAFRLFAQPYLMTDQGGPHDRTLSVILWIYQTAIKQYDLGLASAAALVFLAVVAAITLIQRRLTREQMA
jgi:ABC-type sugar transport system permease subunit